MKLLAEINEQVRFIEEAKEDGEKSLFIEGPFIQTEVVNGNGRVYRKESVNKEIGRYIKESIDKNRAYGELGHPAGPTINLERVSHMIVSLKEDGNNFIGKAKIMDTPYGQIVKNLMKEGAQLGVSSRGMGTLKPGKNGVMEVQNDFRLATAADIVADPSAPDAFVRGVMEQVDWVFDVSTGSWVAQQLVDEVRDTGRKSARELEERKIHFFEKFLNSLK